VKRDRPHSAAAVVKLERDNDWGVILGWCQENNHPTQELAHRHKLLSKKLSLARVKTF
jgi:hypothetical protein